jgi:hypothetical protein
MNDDGYFMTAVRPKYSMGDLIVYCFPLDGQIRANVGYVTGVEYRPPHTYVDDWWYAVRIIPGDGYCKYDQVPQSEIIGQVLHGT